MQIEIGEIYRHFKGNLYKVLTIAEHSETGEELVIYQALYGTNKIYARPEKMFWDLVDKEKYPESTQTYRFEKWNGMAAPFSQQVTPSQKDEAEMSQKTTPVGGDLPLVAEESTGPAYDYDDVDSLEEAMLHPKKEEKKSNELDEGVMAFLDARGFDEKVILLQEMHSRITDDMLRVMAYSMDLELKDVSTEEKYQDLLYCVELRRKFECTRLQ